MQTSLPDLPFTSHGNTKLYGTRSAAKATPRAFPRTDLSTLALWPSFPTDVHRAIENATPRPLPTPVFLLPHFIPGPGNPTERAWRTWRVVDVVAGINLS